MSVEGPSPPPDAPRVRAMPRRRRTERRQQRADSRKRELRLDRVGLGGVTALVLLGPMLLGGAFPWAVSVLAGIGASTLLVCALSSSTSAEERAPTVLMVALSLVAWTALQAAPLPARLVGWVSPASLDDATRSAALLGRESAAYVALSRAPGNTWLEVVKGIAACSALIAGYVLARRGHRLWLLGACGASAALVAIVAVGHLVAGAHTVFGVYKPVHAGLDVLGPLLNPNHLGGVMAFGAPVAAGMAMSTADRRARIAWVLCAIGCAGVCALARSRGAFGALIVGLVAFAGWSLLRSRTAHRGAARYGAALAAAGLVAVSLGAAAYLGLRELWPEFLAEGATDKLEIAGRGLALVERAPWVGVGRGAFGEVFVRVFGDRSRVTHPENQVIQWLSEWGIIAGSVGLVSFAGALGAAILKVRTPARAGAFFGIVAIIAQNLVDFSLEMSGIAVVVAVALGAALAPRTETPGPSRGAPLRRLTLATALLGVVAVAALAPFVDRWSVPSLERSLRDADTLPDRTKSRATLALALKMHPSEPVFPLLAAATAIRQRSPDAPAWLNRAMTLAPRWAASHLLAAAWLRNRGSTSQAWLELREAARLSPRAAGATVCALTGDDVNDFEQSVPLRRAERIPFLLALAECFAVNSPESVRVDGLLEALHVELPQIRRRAATRALSDGRPADALRVLELTPAAERATADSELLVDALSRAGRQRDALRAIELALPRATDRRGLLRRKARVHASLGDAEGMRGSMNALRDEVGGDAAALGATQRLLGDLEQQLGHAARAMAAYELAYTYSGDDSALGSLAAAAERDGNHRRAIAAWERLCSNVGPTSPACARRDRLQALERAGDLPQPTAAQAARPGPTPHE